MLPDQYRLSAWEKANKLMSLLMAKLSIKAYWIGSLWKQQFLVATCFLSCYGTEQYTAIYSANLEKVPSLDCFLAVQLHPCFLLQDAILHTYLASIMHNAEVSFVFQLFWLLELRVAALLLHHFFHKAFISSLWKPALFIQQGQYAGGTSLRTKQLNVRTSAKLKCFRSKRKRKC